MKRLQLFVILILALVGCGSSDGYGGAKAPQSNGGYYESSARKTASYDSMSTQPSVGGPIYWIRNIVYHAPGGSTRSSAGSPGVIFYHNTVTSETSIGTGANRHWRNNLILGQAGGPIFSVTTSTPYSSSDYNGFRVNPGAEVSFEWISPPQGVTADFTGPGRTATLETRRFASMADYGAATGQDRHSIAVDYDVFVNVRRLDAQDAATVQRLYKAADFDFRLKSGSAAVDRGTVLPTVTDGYLGKAPDLGAVEAGHPMPHYGPRN